MGEAVFFGVAGFGGVGDGWAAWIGKTEDFRDFVEGFADGVVEGGADDFERVGGGHIEELGVAAGDDKRKDGKFDCFIS